EVALQRKDGSKLDVSLNVTSLRDADGRLVLARWVWRDITARKQADRDRRFLTDFSELLRNAIDPHAGMARIAERLTQHLKAHCQFVEVDAAYDAFIVRSEVHGARPRWGGQPRTPPFRAEAVAELRAGRTAVERGASDDGCAQIAVPLRVEGELMALLCVYDD